MIPLKFPYTKTVLLDDLDFVTNLQNHLNKVVLRTLTFFNLVIIIYLYTKLLV